MYANIIVDISHEQLDKTFQYHVPDALLSQIIFLLEGEIVL